MNNMNAEYPTSEKLNYKDIRVMYSDYDKELMADCFFGLAISVLREPFLSSDMKQILFSNVMRNLKAIGYTEDELNSVRNKLSAIVGRFMSTNDFMG